MTFTILYVCTGNVCRSPMAELVTRPASRGVEVSSAGTQALVGQGVDGPSAAALSRMGIDPRAHRARQFEARMTVGVDLVLVAERANRDRVLTEVPRVLRRTFTIREFARLSRHLDPDTPDRVVAQAALLRGIDGEVDVRDDDMPDPYRGTVSRAVEIAELTSDAVGTTLSALGLLAGTAEARTGRRPRPGPTGRRPRPDPHGPDIRPRPSTSTVPR